jgi:hypothetical protein
MIPGIWLPLTVIILVWGFILVLLIRALYLDWMDIKKIYRKGGMI